MKRTFILIFAIFLFFTANSQHQILNWYSGQKNHLSFVEPANFEQNFPATLLNSFSINSNSAMGSDSVGNIMVYYADNVTHLPTTSPLPTTIDGVAGATPSPNQPSYIFSEDLGTDFIFNELTLSSLSPSGYNLYLTIDTIFNFISFSLGQENFELGSNLSSKMACFKDDPSIKVVVHELNTNKFRIYNNLPFTSYITESFGPNYGSTVGGAYDDGFMKFSSDGYKLAVSSPGQKELYVYEYNQLTDDIYSEKTVSTDMPFNAIEFTFDNTILYAATDYEIYQILLDQTIPKKILIGNSSAPILNMQMAPDGKIYVVRAGESSYGVIHNPETRGKDCYYFDNGLPLQSSSNGTLPSIPANYLQNIPYSNWYSSGQSSDTIYVGDEVWFNLVIPPMFNTINITWKMGDGTINSGNTPSDSHIYTAPGEYDLNVDINFQPNTTSPWDILRVKRKIVVHPKDLPIIMPADSAFICSGSNSVQLWADYDMNNIFVWQSEDWTTYDSAEFQQDIWVDKPGRYFLRIYEYGSPHGLLASDTVTVFVADIDFLINGTTDTIFNKNEILNFTTEIFQQPDAFINTALTEYSWDFGDTYTSSGIALTSTSHFYTNSGIYSAILEFSTPQCFYYKNKNIIIKSDSIIDPQNTQICDTTEFATLDIDPMFMGYNFDWENSTTGGTYSTTDLQYLTNKPGKYYLKITDGSSNIIAQDTAFVYMFDVNYKINGSDIDTVFMVDEYLLIDAIITQIPQDFIVFASTSFAWDIDDAFQSGYNLNSIDTTFTTPGTRPCELQVFYNTCSKTKKKYLTILPIGNIISPHDTVCCSSDNIILTANYDLSKYFIWYDESYTILLEGIGKSGYTTTSAGKFYLEILEAAGGNQIALDSANVFSFFPSIEINSPLIANQIIDFEGVLNEIPDPFNSYTDISYSWDFGDGTSPQSITNYNFMQHTYQYTGSYTVTLNLFIDGCSFSGSTDIFINNGTEPQIIPHDTLFCKIGDYVDLHIDISTTDYYIKWYIEVFESGTSNLQLVDQNTNNIFVTIPGKYVVECNPLIGNLDFISDTAFVDYNLCENFTANVTINDEFDITKICNNEETLNFKAIINENQSSCDISNYNDMFFFWDMGNGDTFEGEGLMNIDYSYPYGGNYLITLLVFDTKSCQHTVKKRLEVNGQTPDTIRINLLENFVGDIEVNFKQYPQIFANFLGNSRFIKNLNEIIYPYNEYQTTINVPNSYIKTLEDSSSFFLYTEFSYLGNYSIKVITPSGKIIRVAEINNDTLDFLSGHPAIDYYSMDQSKPYTYYFSGNGVDITQPETGEISEWYFSPEKYLLHGNFHRSNPNIYKIKDANLLTDETLSGDWQFIFNGEGRYGYVNNVGIMFPNNYFYMPMLPDSLSCVDQFGNNYSTTDSLLIINNMEEEQYILNCDFYYSKTDCLQEKTIIVNVPQIPNTFSPNGDGINDTWRPVEEGIEAQIIIIDRNGRIVADFTSTDNPYGWDGKLNDKPLPSDSYWYIISYLEGYIVKGVITIIR
ncbi:MAG: T9SS type B sorting domain-containing protein [Bacteroidales bacterium]|nr:T9SS type B sorting domain-containing protein [Bacteroidales bacterium]